MYLLYSLGWEPSSPLRLRRCWVYYSCAPNRTELYLLHCINDQKNKIKYRDWARIKHWEKQHCQTPKAIQIFPKAPGQKKPSNAAGGAQPAAQAKPSYVEMVAGHLMPILCFLWTNPSRRCDTAPAVCCFGCLERSLQRAPMKHSVFLHGLCSKG